MAGDNAYMSICNAIALLHPYPENRRMPIKPKLSAPPVAQKISHVTTAHGVTRNDDYAWMRADNWQTVMQQPDALAAHIREHLERENDWQEAWMEDTRPLQGILFDEMKGRIKEDDSSVPLKDGAWEYGISYVKGAEQPRFIRRPANSSNSDTIKDEPAILLDGDLEAQGKSYFRIGGCGHSPDHAKLAWSYDDKGSEYFTIYFQDIASDEQLAPPIPNTNGGGAWSKDSQAYFYTLVDENHRPSKLFLRQLNDNSADTLVYEEEDSGFFMGAGKSQSGDYLIIDIHDHQTSESWLIPANAPETAPVIVEPREPGIEYSLDEGNGTLYILTNRDGAQDFKIMTAKAATPGAEHWQELIPHEAGRLILSHSIFARHLVWLERRDGLPRIVIRNLQEGSEHAISFDEEAYSLGLTGSYEFDTDIIRFSYSSMTTPGQTFDYNMQTRERTLLKTQEVPSGHNQADYVTRRIEAKSHDGALVPVSLIYHKDTPLDGSAPCLLYGYGSYGIAIPASFNTSILSLVDRGFIYAIAHIRGGKDKGFYWYESGKRQDKKNTFMDFVAVGDHLIAGNYTSQGKIMAHGGSAGGMLMGAVANMRPELFAGLIAEVPFVDVLNTMLDDTLPLTPPEWPEWGNPIESKQDHDYILSYSPYDQISEQDYPTILAIGGLTDPRVTYWEPAKWVARLREMNTSDNAILLKTNMGAGHGGASGRFARLEEVALTQAFALKVAGIGV